MAQWDKKVDDRTFSFMLPRLVRSDSCPSASVITSLAATANHDCMINGSRAWIVFNCNIN
jgi:hypothetical protein